MLKSVQSFRPAFKAHFSKDRETQKILYEITENNISLNNEYTSLDNLYIANNLLKQIEPDDTISLSLNEKETVPYEKAQYILKNENNGAKIKLDVKFGGSLSMILSKLFFSQKHPLHMKLFGNKGNEKPVKDLDFNGFGHAQAEYHEDLLDKTKEHLVKNRIENIRKNNELLQAEIKKNNKEIKKLVHQQIEKTRQFVRSDLGLLE